MGIEPTLQAYVLKVGVLIKLHGRWQDHYLNLRLYGGGGGIRTHGPLRVSCFLDKCTRPTMRPLHIKLAEALGLEPRHRYERLLVVFKTTALPVRLTPP